MRPGIAPLIAVFAAALFGASVFGAMQISTDFQTGNMSGPNLSIPNIFSHGVSPCGIATSFLNNIREKNFEKAADYVSGRYNDTPGTEDRIRRFHDIYANATDVECVCAVDAIDGNGKAVVFAYSTGSQQVYERFGLEYTTDGWKIDFSGETLKEGGQLTSAGRSFTSQTSCQLSQ